MSLELVHVHFPKAAGTSIVHALRSLYGDALLADYTLPPPDDWSGDAARVPDGVRAVCGHFHANRYAQWPATRITFLREPVDNLISIYYFWLTFPPSGYLAHERFLAAQPTIFEFAQYPEIRTLASELYFGGVDLAAFAFVGFFEHRVEALARLSSLLGFPLGSDLHVNRTEEAFDRSRHELKADSAAMRKLREILCDDIAFYERALERFA